MKYVSSVLLILSLFVGACSDAPVGSKRRPFTMYFVPSTDAEQIAHGADGFGTYVSKAVSQKLYGADTGFYVKTAIPMSYIALVEGFGSKKADFAVINTFSYILAKDIKKYDVEAVLSVIRNENEMTYKAAIFARSDSKIKSIKDLHGKKFAYVDPASASGFILPSKLFKENGIQLGDTVFAQKHDNVISMIYQGQVEAGAAYYMTPKTTLHDGKEINEIRDARVRVKTQFPDVEQKVKIIGYSEEVPNEPWVIRKNIVADTQLNQKIKEAVVEAVLDYSKTPEGKALLLVLATGSGLTRITDEDYAGIRKSIVESDLDLESVLKKSKG